MYGLGERLSDFIGVYTSETPAIRIIVSKEENVVKYQFKDALTAKNLLAFVEDFHAGKLEPVYKS